MGKSCSACDVVYDRGYFSQSQWTKPVGTGRCIDCVNQGRLVTNNDSETARKNESSRATFTNDALKHPFSQGTFRWVAKGKYEDGPRNGQDCVCKWFKDGHVMEREFFDLDIKAMHKALDLVQAWNIKKFVSQVIRVNMPAVWQFEDGSGPWAGNLVLQEPFIANYQKFNSNSGWADSSTAWPQLMQALSHFSYHTSAGQFVLCDLQGGIYSNGVILTDPVILSQNKQYGITDLGPKGISSFFSNHTCNQYCRSNWNKPADQTRYHSAQMGTSMAGSAMPPVPNRHSRPAMSAVNKYY